jgi:hypothetical protein
MVIYDWRGHPNVSVILKPCAYSCLYGSWTHPGMLAYFDVPRTLYDRPNCNGAMFGFNSQDARAMKSVIRPVCSDGSRAMIDG